MDLLARMETFVRVVDAGNLTRAARQLDLSVAAVSRHVAELEHSVGTALLARTTRTLAITATGQQYYERCRRVLGEVDHAQAIAGELVDAPVRLSIPVAIGVEAATRLLGPLFDAQPELRVDLRLEDRVIDLAVDDVDVAIRVTSRPLASDRVIAQPLSSWPRTLVASAAYLRRRGTPRAPEELAEHDLLASGRDARWSLSDGKRSVELDVAPRLLSNGGHVLRELARAGHGIALLPAWFGRRDPELVRVLPGWEAPLTTIYLLYRVDVRKRPRVRAVVEHLRRAYPAFERG